MFKMAMRNNVWVTLGPPNTINLLTNTWRLIMDFLNTFLQHFKIFKLGKIDMIQVLGSLEDEQMFSNLNFIKSKIHN